MGTRKLHKRLKLSTVDRIVLGVSGQNGHDFVGSVDDNNDDVKFCSALILIPYL